MYDFIDQTPGLQNPSACLSDDDKVMAVVAYLTESHLDLYGGYPYDWIAIDQWLIIAELDDGKDRNRTSISTYKRKTIIDWYDSAVHQLDCGADDIIDALILSMPDEDQP